MENEHMLRMVNRIGDFFESMPDAQEAEEGIATHIKKFWEPRMLKQLYGYLENNGPGMHPMVEHAIRTHLMAKTSA